MDTRSRATLLLPHLVIDHVIQSALDEYRRIAVLLPLSSQLESTYRHFDCNDRLLLFALAPTAIGEAIDKTALTLQDRQIDLVVLRCFSYPAMMKDAIADRTSSRTILARSLLAESLSRSSVQSNMCSSD